MSPDSLDLDMCENTGTILYRFCRFPVLKRHDVGGEDWWYDVMNIAELDPDMR